MFGFGKVVCVLCDQQVARKQALKVQGQNGVTICRGCLERWQVRGACPECGAPLRGTQEPGIFLERKRALGHADCGATRLIAL
jgi:hypothetical protein